MCKFVIMSYMILCSWGIRLNIANDVYIDTLGLFRLSVISYVQALTVYILYLSYEFTKIFFLIPLQHD